MVAQTSPKVGSDFYCFRPRDGTCANSFWIPQSYCRSLLSRRVRFAKVTRQKLTLNRLNLLLLGLS